MSMERTSGVIIGGTAATLRHPHVLQQVDQWVGGGGSLVIVTTPAYQAPSTMPDLTDRYRLGTLRAVGVVSMCTRQDGFDPAHRRLVERADAILVASDDAIRCISMLSATPLWNSILERGAQGAPLISYGASGAMLGVYLLVERTGHPAELSRALHLPPALATVPNAVIDAEGYSPARLRVLARAIAQNPCHLGLVIDARTAILVRNNHVEVLGDGHVYVFDGRGSAAITEDGEAGHPGAPWYGLRLQRLSGGAHFPLTHRPTWPDLAYVYEMLRPRGGDPYGMN